MSRSPPTQADAEAAVRTLIEWAGDDPEREGLLEHVTVLGQKLRDGLAADPRVTEVTGEGLLIGVVTTVDTAKIAAAALARGFILNNATSDRLRLAPPLVLTEGDAAAFLAAWPAILDAAQEA